MDGEQQDSDGYGPEGNQLGLAGPAKVLDGKEGSGAKDTEQDIL